MQSIHNGLLSDHDRLQTLHDMLIADYDRAKYDNSQLKLKLKNQKVSIALIFYFFANN